MKCSNCGHESSQDFTFCPTCGTQVQSSTAQLNPIPSQPAQSPAALQILPILQDKLFCVLCILMSVSCLMALTNEGLPLINILVTVFLWLTYAQGCKNIADEKHLRCVSGCVYAMYVINYVLASIVLVIGAIFAIAFSYLAGTPAYLEAILTGLVDMEVYEIIAEVISFIPAGLIFIIFLFVSALLLALNIFSIRYLHRFIQSVYRSLESGEPILLHTRTAMIWLFIIGGFKIPDFLSNLSNNLIAALGSGAEAAVCIIAGLLIRNYLLLKAPETEL